MLLYVWLLLHLKFMIPVKGVIPSHDLCYKPIITNQWLTRHNDASLWNIIINREREPSQPLEAFLLIKLVKCDPNKMPTDLDL